MRHTDADIKDAAVIRVLIADDHPVVRSGVKGMLESHPDFDVVGEAADGTEAVGLTLREHPDVVLMDLQMPGLDGASATAQIKAQRPQTQVLVLTTYGTDADIVRAIDAGAVGYLLKDAPHEEVTRAVRAAARGETTLAPAIAQRLMQRVRTACGEALSAREIEVLQLAARGLSNNEIAKELFVSATTAKAHLVHIYSKLGVNDRTAAVTTALERGIIRLDQT
jgi:DNA-binding NarL/FixJ family response regulator